jgi:tRNA-dihydrouridine synthase 2
MVVIFLLQMYSNKLILAPMVRVGTLPMRLCALDYGADLVYTDEIIDKKIIKTERIVNKGLGTVDFVHNDTVVFRTTAKEKNRVIFQMGSASPELALEAALKVKNDVAGIDLNCGCPKHFSVHAGMGSALLKNQELLCSILKMLVDNVELPITCKIRMLETEEETIKLVQKIEATGVRAIALHCRTVSERPKDKGHWEIFKPISDALQDIPLIANGDIYSWSDIEKVRQSGIRSVMIARAAQRNPSVFRRQGELPIEKVIEKYVRYSVQYDMPYQNVKFVVAPMISSHKKRSEVTRSKSLQEIW